MSENHLPQDRRGVRRLEAILALSGFAFREHKDSISNGLAINRPFRIPQPSQLAERLDQPRMNISMLYKLLIKSGAIYSNGVGRGKLYRTQSFEKFTQGLKREYLRINRRIYYPCLAAPQLRGKINELHNVIASIARSRDLMESLLFGLYSCENQSRVDYRKSVEVFVRDVETARQIAVSLSLIPLNFQNAVELPSKINWNKNGSTRNHGKDLLKLADGYDVLFIVPLHFGFMQSNSFRLADISSLKMDLNHLELIGLPFGLEQLEYDLMQIERSPHE